ncbi:MAG: sugar ABC transporter substrate-binding protein [Actinobacteria bacterium]|nr:sugar ABC transporter substrate-binding protein [Actinomycetota bacterium]MCL6088224.1 sugar ABC transporter substrate-binding protein [Actinomycetota bacterium]
MKRIKISTIVLVTFAIIATLVILPGCKTAVTTTTAAAATTTTAAAETTAAETTKAAKTYKIVNLWLGMAAPYCPPYKATFEAGAKENGWDLTFFDGKFDAALQANQMDEAIAMKPDLIILCALDASGMAAGMKKAFDAGIPLIVDHTLANKEDQQYTIAYTGPDNYTEGLLGGELMNEALGGKGKVVIITGATGQEAAINRPKGFRDKLKELNSQIEVLAEQTAEWDKAKATKVMADFITRYGKELNGVYGADDTLAVGAFIALQEAGYKKGDLILVGVGGSKEGLAAIKDGTIYGTVLQSPVAGAKAAIETIKKALEQGIKPPKQMDPYLRFMPLPKITAANVDQYLPGEW